MLNYCKAINTSHVVNNALNTVRLTMVDPLPCINLLALAGIRGKLRQVQTSIVKRGAIGYGSWDQKGDTGYGEERDRGAQLRYSAKQSKA
jgi:hypothetical protein